MIGIKGDWPYIRKAVHMAVGFKSKRVCHLCPGGEPQLRICMQVVTFNIYIIIYIYIIYIYIIYRLFIYIYKDWSNQKYVLQIYMFELGCWTKWYYFCGSYIVELCPKHQVATLPMPRSGGTWVLRARLARGKVKCQTLCGLGRARRYFESPGFPLSHANRMSSMCST
jgi:hypothetical protein